MEMISNRLMLIWIGLLLTACGGGGSGTSSIVPLLQEIQAVNDSANTSPRYVFSSNAVGQLQFSGSCSSTTVEAVAGNNSVVFDNVSPGEHSDCAVQLTNIDGKRSNTLAISTFTTLPLPSDQLVTVWVGAQDSLIQLESLSSDAVLFVDSNRKCDVTTGSNCSDLQEHQQLSETLVDTSFTLSNIGAQPSAAYLTLHQSGVASSPKNILGQLPAGRLHAFDNRLWMLNDKAAWFSDDGDNWQKNAVSIFNNAFQHGDEIWQFSCGFISGTGSSSCVSGVPSLAVSKNATDWTFSNGDFDPVNRVGSTRFSFNDKLWIVGGAHLSVTLLNGYYYNDIWSSSNGVDWLQQPLVTDFPSVISMQAINFDGKLWLYSGLSKDPTQPSYIAPTKNDILWSSVDGTTWLSHGKMSLQWQGNVFSRGDRLWSFFYENNAWVLGSSADGFSWQVEDHSVSGLGFSKAGSVVALKDEYFSQARNSLFFSKNARHWQSVTTESGIVPKGGKEFEFNGRLWSVRSDTLTSSANGLDWQFEASRSESPLLPLWTDNIWVLGDKLVAYPIAIDKKQVNVSTDPLQWPAAVATNFERTLQALLEHKNRLWRIRDEVWVSDNGLDWQLHADPTVTAFPLSLKTSVASLNDTLYVYKSHIGITVDTQVLLWTSVDGINWQQQNLQTTLPLSQMSLLSFAEALWVFKDGVLYRSVDGAVWETIALPSNVGDDLYYIQAFDDRLWLSNASSDNTWASKDGREWRKLKRTTLSFQ